MKAIFVRAQYGEHTDIFKNNGFAAISWFNEPATDYTEKTEILKQYRKEFPGDSNGRTYQNVGQIYRFWNDIHEGDIVISTYNDGSLIIGTAKGKPYFKKDNIIDFYDRIDVDWKAERFDRYQLSIPLQNTIKSSLTVFNVWQVAEIAKLAGIGLPTEHKQTVENVSLTQESVYNSIKERLLHLDDGEFEIFVSYILQSLGFEAKQQHGGVGDGGVDFEGVLDVVGVATTKLQVQVKRYEKSVIGELAIRSFRGALKRDYQGTFITLSDFNKKAVESARDEQRTRIHLINGKQLVEIFIQQYDKVVSLMEENDAQELLGKLKFKKVIIPN